ncbi:hypothetical protein [Pseudomonas sp. HY13-MNA-CIBAN-0226]|uniref:hypothetical protein n=1 Tax=Pseudomonas sp. HY13-MNA-CIBAN-0226 TaxID=3140473 RepID=UPI003320ECE7
MTTLIDISLADRFLDASIDGLLGKGQLVTRQEFIDFFADEPKNTTGCFLSNSEMNSGTHSPHYRKLTLRVSDGVYRIHPDVLLERMKQRNIV